MVKANFQAEIEFLRVDEPGVPSVVSAIFRTRDTL
jgi:hypothetical protein